MSTKDIRDGGEERRTTSKGSTISLPVDVTVQLLAHHHRRTILTFLQGATDRPVTVEEILDFLVDQASDSSGERAERATIAVAVHHNHLPKLVGAGVIDYDTAAGTVRYWTEPLLEDLLDRIRAADPNESGPGS